MSFFLVLYFVAKFLWNSLKTAVSALTEKFIYYAILAIALMQYCE